MNYSLSLANPPVFNGSKVTITLKHYMWSNGTPVTAQDVMFWLNMEMAEPANYGAYTGFPANVKDITVVSPTELTMTHGQGLLADLVPVQRPEPDHPDAAPPGTGPRPGRATAPPRSATARPCTTT